MQKAGSVTEDDTIDGKVLTNARRKRGDVEMMDGKRGGVEFRTKQAPIDHYRSRKIITMAEYRAAERLFKDFTVSGQSPGMTINLDPIRSGLCNFTQAQMEARERWRQALNDVPGHIAKLMLINVCCYGYWLKDIEFRYYRTSQQAMSRFHEALDDLIKHYDLTRNSH